MPTRASTSIVKTQTENEGMEKAIPCRKRAKKKTRGSNTFIGEKVDSKTKTVTRQRRTLYNDEAYK